MNQSAGQPAPEQEQRLIDRLVDGELSDSERRRFLQGLDDDPAQWRQVALGFIESQCCAEACDEITSLLSEDIPCCVPFLGAQQSCEQETSENRPAVSAAAFNAAAERSATANCNTANSGSRETSETVHRRVMRYLPVVASVAVAFTLGFIAQSRYSDWANRASQRLPTPGMISGVPAASPVATHLSKVNNTVDGLPEIPVRTVNLPLVRGSKSTNSWLKQSDRVVSPDMEESFYRYGHLVSEKKRVYRVQLKDGRRVLVPVKDIELKFIGNRGYQ